MTGSSVNRVIFNLIATDVAATADFYTHLLGLKRHFDSDWYVILVPETGPLLELGIISSDSEFTPMAAKGVSAGAYPTLVVADVHAVYSAAKKMDAQIIEAPKDLPYGQTRMLLQDPNGVIVDISSLTK